jgi:hypothetical protein
MVDKVRFKCYNCFLIFSKEDMIEDCCPECHTNHLLKKMCERDTGVCTCAEDAKPSVILCPVCNDPICPNDGSHDVVGVSRVKLEKIRSF